MKIGLFFGSFNPIHIGHLAIAKYMALHAGLDKVWLVVSPHNPLKDKNSLADTKQRVLAVRKAIKKYPKLKVCTEELTLPRPSYTIRTLRHLSKKYPQHVFSLIIGSDNLVKFSEWKGYKKILSGYKMLVYPRKGSKGGKLSRHPNVVIVKAPQINVSSTQIRELMRKGKSVQRFVPRDGHLQ